MDGKHWWMTRLYVGSGWVGGWVGEWVSGWETYRADAGTGQHREGKLGHHGEEKAHFVALFNAHGFQDVGYARDFFQGFFVGVAVFQAAGTDLWVGRWVGGWVDGQQGAFSRTSLRVGGWVGGWVNLPLVPLCGAPYRTPPSPPGPEPHE